MSNEFNCSEMTVHLAVMVMVCGHHGIGPLLQLGSYSCLFPN